MDFGTIFGDVVWAGAITFGIGVVWKMATHFFHNSKEK